MTSWRGMSSITASSDGVCGVPNTSTRTGMANCGIFRPTSVSTCLMTDVTCEATCACASGYFGSTCEMTSSGLKQAQTVRGTLIQGLYNVGLSANPTPDEASSTASSLAALTQQPLELSPASAAVANTIAHYHGAIVVVLLNKTRMGA